MQQRAGRRHEQALRADAPGRLLERIERGVEVRAPDVAAVDDAERQGKTLGSFRQRALDLCRPAHQV